MSFLKEADQTPDQAVSESIPPPTLEDEVNRLKKRFMDAFGLEDGSDLTTKYEVNDNIVIKYNHSLDSSDDDWCLEIIEGDDHILLGRNPLRPHKFFAEIRLGTYERPPLGLDAVPIIDTLFDRILPKPPVQTPTPST